MRFDDDSVAAADVNNSIGTGAAFRGDAAEVEMAGAMTLVVEGTKARADDIRARQKKRVDMVRCIMISSTIDEAQDILVDRRG